MLGGLLFVGLRSRRRIERVVLLDNELFLRVC